jgi:hypothetical protein
MVIFFRGVERWEETTEGLYLNGLEKEQRVWRGGGRRDGYMVGVEVGLSMMKGTEERKYGIRSVPAW